MVWKRACLHAAAYVAPILLMIPAALIPGSGGADPLQYTIELLPTIAVFFLALSLSKYFRNRTSPDIHIISGTFLYALLVLSTVLALAFSVKTEIAGLRQIIRFFHYFYACILFWCIWRGWSMNSLLLLVCGLLSTFPFLWGAVWNPLGSVPLLSVVIFVFTGHTFGLNRLSSHEKSLQMDVLRSVLLLCGLLVVISCMRSAVPFKGVHQTIRFFLILICLDWLFSDGAVRRKVHFVFGLVLVCNAAFLAVGAVYYALLQGELSPGLILAKKTSLAGINSNDAGAYLVLGMLFWFAPQRWSKQRPFWIRIALILFALLLVLLVFFIQARIALLSLVGALVGTVGLYAFLRLYRQRDVRSVSLVVACVAVMLMAMGATVMFMYAYALRPVDLYATLFERFALWEQARAYLWSHPQGAGPAQHLSLLAFGPMMPATTGYIRLQASFLKNGADLHAHNLMLQIWLDYGPVILLGLVLLIGIGLARIRADRRALLMIVPVLSALLIQGLFNYHLINPAYAFLTAIVLGSIGRLRWPRKRWSAATRVEKITGIWIRISAAVLIVTLTAGMGAGL